MPDTKQWRKDVRDTAKQVIPGIVPINGIQLTEIYDGIRKQRPALCDPQVPCTHNGKSYGPYEWQHQVRWALQDLKSRGVVASVGNSRWARI